MTYAYQEFRMPLGHTEGKMVSHFFVDDITLG